jgi:hypothetical protein
MISMLHRHPTIWKALRTRDETNDQKGRYHELGEKDHYRHGTGHTWHLADI